MTAQAITDAGAVSANWALVTAFAVIGFLLITFAGVVAHHFVTALDAMKVNILSLETRTTAIEITQAKTESEIRHILEEREEVLDKIFTKLEALRQ